MRCLGRPPLDLICREFFKVSDTRLESLYALPFADVRRGPTSVDAAIAGGPAARLTVAKAAVAGMVGARVAASAGREVGRLVIL